MIVLIAGATHTGKTLYAQELLERYHYPTLSLDLLKMGLIRSRYTQLTPEDDEQLKDYLWPIVREIIKTAIENHQNLVIEGIYLPFDWKKDFSMKYQKDILYRCLIMTPNYIKHHFNDIMQYANVIEKRLDDSECTTESLIQENRYHLEMCKNYHLPYIQIDKNYQVPIDLENEAQICLT